MEHYVVTWVWPWGQFHLSESESLLGMSMSRGLFGMFLSGGLPGSGGLLFMGLLGMSVSGGLVGISVSGGLSSRFTITCLPYKFADYLLMTITVAV